MATKKSCGKGCSTAKTEVASAVTENPVSKTTASKSKTPKTKSSKK